MGWQFEDVRFGPDCEDLPDGSNPYDLTRAWGPWVARCVDCLDGKGTMRHWPSTGVYDDEPARDVIIYRIIRSEWVRLTNDKLERSVK